MKSWVGSEVLLVTVLTVALTVIASYDLVLLGLAGR